MGEVAECDLPLVEGLDFKDAFRRLLFSQDEANETKRLH